MAYYSKSDAQTEHRYFPIIDEHIHVKSLKRALKYNDLLNETGFRGMCVQCLPRFNDEFLTSNLVGMLLKLLQYGETYVFGGFHRPLEGQDPRSQDYLAMVQFLHQMGADGIKMYDAKPIVRKQLGMALDCPEFQPMYAYLEDNQLPMLNHIGDPANFWDGDDAPDLAKQNGWVYDHSYCHPEQYFTEVTHVFDRHPRLKMILAHCFFLSVNRPRLEAFLEKYPNAYIDITPGMEMYSNFSRDRAAWKDFFIRFQDRIIFGTDNGFFDESTYEINAIRTFLETEKTFSAWDMELHGIALPDTALRKIYYNNIKGLVKQPRLPDFQLMKDEYKMVMQRAERSPLREELLKDLGDIAEVLTHFGVVLD